MNKSFPFSKQRIRRSGAFTLVETALVVSIVAVIGLAVFHALANGLEVWKRSRALSADEDVAIFFDKLERDLHNSFRYQKLPFKGDGLHLTFPTIVHAPVDPKHPEWDTDEYVDLMGLVEYRFDASEQGVYRRQANYGQAMSKEFEDPRLLAGHIKGLRFRYYYINPGDEKGELVDEYEGELPSAVLVMLEFDEPTGGTRTLTRLVNLPAARQR